MQPNVKTSGRASQGARCADGIGTQIDCLEGMALDLAQTRRPGSRLREPGLRVRTDLELDGVGAGGDAAALAGPVGVEELAAGLVEALVGVGAEVVALGLEQVGGQAAGAVAVEECERGRERRSGYAELDGGHDRLAPGCLVLVDGAQEELVEEQVVEVLLFVEGGLDVAQELAANNATAAPHESDTAHVQVPAVLLGSGFEQHVALRVGDDLGAIEGAAHILNECGTVADGGLRLGSLEDLGGGDALVFECGQTARKDRLADEGDGLTGVE